jgi:hypothetical protein
MDNIPRDERGQIRSLSLSLSLSLSPPLFPLRRREAKRSKRFYQIPRARGINFINFITPLLFAWHFYSRLYSCFAPRISFPEAEFGFSVRFNRRIPPSPPPAPRAAHYVE